MAISNWQLAFSKKISWINLTSLCVSYLGEVPIIFVTKTDTFSKELRK